ncbi:DMT family transporter [Natrinema longum]|uniref:DMT family transporter n=1 Tax=Natrinema longum TaxID=370324 RepID=UPI001CCEBD81|nr:DMT family transporter [Natrinema longum]MBZ6496966.1 DMT family transporter [Natrinema longum]
MLFVLLALIWGSLFIFIELGLPYIPPVLFAALRHDLAAVITLIYAVYASTQWLPRGREDWWLVALGAVFFVGLYNGFLFVGQQGVTGGMAAILVAMNPILAALFGWVLIPQHRLTLTGIGGLLLGFVEVSLVTRPDFSAPLQSESLGALLVLLATACLAFGSVLVERASSSLSTKSFVAWSNVLGALFLHGISFGLPSESFTQVNVTVAGLGALLYLAVIGSGASAILYFVLLDELGAVEINLVSYAAPIFTAILAWLILSEALDPLSIIGFVIIFTGFALIKRRELRMEFRKILST